MTQQDGATGVATVAKDQAGQVGRTAADAGGQVAQTTKEQAQNVVGEAKQQARDLVGEARSQASTQAGTQKTRAVEQLRTLGDELHQMSQQGGQSGLATEVARQVAGRTHGLADYLDRHEPADLIDEARRYARRHPVMFLAGAAVAGVLAGRLTRNLASSDEGSDRQGLGAVDTGYVPPAVDTSYQPTEVYPATGYVEPASGYTQGTGYAEPTPGYTQPGYTEPGYVEPGYAGQPAPGFVEPEYPARPGYGTNAGDAGWRNP